MVSRHRLTGTQRAARDVACWLWGHDDHSEDFDRRLPCGCRDKGSETTCHRCGKVLGTLHWGGLSLDSTITRNAAAKVK